VFLVWNFSRVEFLLSKLAVIYELVSGLKLGERQFPVGFFRKKPPRAQKEYLGTKVFFKVAFSVVTTIIEVKLNSAYLPC